MNPLPVSSPYRIGTIASGRMSRLELPQQSRARRGRSRFWVRGKKESRSAAESEQSGAAWSTWISSASWRNKSADIRRPRWERQRRQGAVSAEARVRTLRFRVQRWPFREEAGTPGYVHAKPKEHMNPEKFERISAAGCKAWYVDAEELETKIKDLVVAQRSAMPHETTVRELLLARLGHAGPRGAHHPARPLSGRRLHRGRTGARNEAGGPQDGGRHAQGRAERAGVHRPRGQSAPSRESAAFSSSSTQASDSAEA